jgi:hypothetical protein
MAFEAPSHPFRHQQHDLPRYRSEVSHDLRQILQSENFVPEVTPKLLFITETMATAREAHEKQQDKRKEVADAKRRPSPLYKPGDKVWVNSHTLSNANKGRTSKFTPKRDGLYVILAAKGPCSYEIASPTNPLSLLGTYHVSAISPYQGPTDDTQVFPIVPIRKRGRPRKNTNFKTTRRVDCRF